ncbi:UvrD-helicase domain-containing protein [Peribacillus frigoritolerans]|uniref:UvrD-helicase domain-containing protein n=1 Tax=Peribacillus frigoritolerans TaxID=450367 RepID=UPI002E2372F0|nr:UvrD-helicase domain-containing protein [Peribacillus frigoritolerans]MED3757625.1 UvrD-helicase domain-containing protein [Peribacillus frigoritolerans]
MNSLIETRESLVISILKTSKNIENIIKCTYKKEYEKVARHPSVRKEQMPIFVAFLYDLIIEDKALPSNKHFIEKYMKRFYDDIQPENLLYHAYLYRVNEAYESLVRDLHFYFKLTESRLFDDILLSYAYDIEAKQDVVVYLGEKKLGLQLFKGNDKTIPQKRKQTRRRRIILGYPDFYLPLYGSRTTPINIGSKKAPFYVYSDRDVKLIYDELISQPEFSAEMIEEEYVFPMDVKKNTIFNELNNRKSQNEKSNVRHSFIYIGEKNINQDLELINELLKNGVRVEWISPKKNYVETVGNLRVHSWDEASKYNLIIKDGNYNDWEKELLIKIGNYTTFNCEQYLIEHAPNDKHLMVEAGAGSGKTETLISRIIYLLHTKELNSLDQVVMITFTNEAADHMKLKLSKRLYKLFEITSDLRYITWSEQVTSMRILTIPSFSKTLIQDFSSELGMSRDFAIRALTVERRDIISDILDKYINDNKLSYQDLGELKEYEIVKMIDEFWNQFEQKGIVFENYQGIDWGTSPEKAIEREYFKLFKHVLEECEKGFSEEKLKKDVFTVNDLTQKISKIQPFLDVDLLSKPFEFLFVDEFQDTDDIQINLVHTLAKLTEAQLFVVGDIKQSIYRFRGANYTAFDLLAEKIGEDRVNREYKLIKNYRTTSRILDSIEDIFDIWRNHRLQILPRANFCEGKDNRLKPTVKTKKYNESYKVDTKIDDISLEIINLFQTLKQDENDKKENKPVELAILVRTNSQANEIRKILENLRAAEAGLVYEVITGGSLFASKAARDLLILLNAFSYEKDAESYYSLHQTPFSKKSFDPATLLHLNGNRKKVLENISYDEVQGFRKAQDELRKKPSLHVIYSFITTNPFEEILVAEDLQEPEIQKYRLNIYRILELASDAFDSSKLSINSLRNWLEVQVATNRNEDEMEVDITQYEKFIKVMTIHKSKGLEFDTVFIPFTNQPLIRKTDQNMIVIRDKEEVKAGWKSSVSKGIFSTNYHTLKETEDEECIREEARL